MIEERKERWAFIFTGENVELSQHQAKLIDVHQQQMEIMKKDLDEGYNSIIQEFQREQARLQTRYEQLKQQLTDAQQIIEQLRINLTHLKSARFNESGRMRDTHVHDKSLQEHRHQQETLQARVEHLIKLLDQSNET